MIMLYNLLIIICQTSKHTQAIVNQNKARNPYIAITVDMGRKIGANENGNGSYSLLRMVVNENTGDIISSFPVGTRSII